MSIKNFSKCLTLVAALLLAGCGGGGTPPGSAIDTNVVELSGLNGDNGFILNGIDGADASGTSVSAGDVNGDSISDLIIGAPHNGLGTEPGETYVVFGSSAGWPASIELSLLNGNNGFVLNGCDPGELCGSAVSSGDINGDGIDDVVIISEGGNYVVFGSNSSWPANIDLSSLDGSNGFNLDDSNRTIFLRGDSASIGDVNGDGIDDLIIGSPTNGFVTVGPRTFPLSRTYVVFGSNTGWPATFDLSTLDGNNGLTLLSNVENGHSGLSVDSGDVNGDGIDDVIIGGYSVSFSPSPSIGSGPTYVVFGRNAGWPASIELMSSRNGRDFSSSLDGSNGFIITDDLSRSDASGASVGAGDVNGDGIDDVIIGAPASSSISLPRNPGKTYLVFGSNSGWPASFALSSLNGGNGLVINGINIDDRSGNSVSAGDVNGDGFDDVIIAAPNADPNGSINGGEAYVLFGSNNSWPLGIELSSLDGINGFVMKGNLSGGNMKAFKLGDVNGDGIGDLSVSVPGAYSNASGKTYVVFGCNNTTHQC